VRKVRVVLAEKSLPYELIPVNPFQPPEGFLRRSPLKKIPVLVDASDGDETVIPDSSVICSYLEQQHPETSLYPAAARSRARALWLEEYSDGGVTPVAGPGVFQAIVLRQLRGEAPDVERANETLQAGLHPYLDYYERELGDREFFVEDRLSIADIAIASPFVNLAHAGAVVPSQRWPALAAFLERMHQRPSFASAIAEETMFHRPVDLSWS
jgi:glutathione S-transferase